MSGTTRSIEIPSSELEDPNGEIDDALANKKKPTRIWLFLAIGLGVFFGLCCICSIGLGIFVLFASDEGVTMTDDASPSQDPAETEPAGFEESTAPEPATATPTPTMIATATSTKTNPAPSSTPSLTPTPSITSTLTSTPTPTTTPTPSTTPTQTLTSTPEPTVNPLTADHFDGFYGVGIDIAPGRWQVNSPFVLLGNPDCYWARYNIIGNVIEDDYGSAPPYIITVLATDIVIELDHCGRVIYLGP